MKHKLILSTILIIVLSLFALDVMPSRALSTGGAILLHTSLDDMASIASPTVGIGGSTTLAAGDFVAAQTGNGAHFRGEGKVALFPAADGGTQNVDLKQGEVEFWYRPNYEPEEDDVLHYMFVVGSIDNPPSVSLVEGDRLTFSFTDMDFNSYVTQAEYRADLWDANQWVHIRATWDSASNDPLRLYVDSVRVDDGATGGWELGSEADIGSIFVGAGDANGVFSAEGVMDELIIRDTPQVPPTATPTNTPDPDKPTNTPTPSPTPLSGGGITAPDLVLTAAPLSRPAYNSEVMEPVFGTTMRRVTDEYATGGFGTQIYSQLQAFSPDNSHLLVIETGGYVVRRLDDLSLVPLETAGWNAPRWQPGLSNTIVHYDSNEDKTLRVQYTDVASQQTSTVFTFPVQYQRIRSNQSFDELSHNGRWMAGLASRDDGVQVIFALDLENQSLGAELPIPDLYANDCQPDPKYGDVEPDWIGVSPLGNYLVVQWTRDGTTRCSGLETFHLTTGDFIGRAYDGHAHGDLGVLPDGTTEFFMTFELENPDAGGLLSVGYRELPGTSTVSPPTYLLVMDWNAGHISCQGPNGLCLVTTEKSEKNGWSALEGELFLLSTNGDVRRIVHHRSSSCSYWVQPRASLSRDGRYVIFASDWEQETGVDGCDTEKYLGRGDAYVIDLETSTPPNTATPTLTAVPGGETYLYLPLIVKAGTSTAVTSTPTATTVPATSISTATIEAATSTPTVTTAAATSTPSATTAAATSTPTPTATTSSGGGTFSPQVIDGSIVHGQGMTVVDIDEDGDQDVVVALSLTDAVYLYVNGGDSAGGGDGSTWATVPIAGDGMIVGMQTTIADFDNDNDLDIAAVGLFDRSDPCGNFCSPGEVTWYENPGNVQGSWTRHVIVEALWGARYLDAVDLTGDDLPDLVVSAININSQGGGLYWLHNEGNGAWSAPIAVDATLSGGEITLAHDVDSDNVPDLIAVDYDNGALTWYENDRTAGTPNNSPSFTAHPIASLPAPYHINLVNMDADPAMELVVTSDMAINWYDAPTTPTNPWTANTIGDISGSQYETVYAADFDGDTDIDVAVAVRFQDAATLGWYRNDGAGTWTWQTIQDYGGLNQITGGDINGDGLPDLVTSTYEQQAGADQITWWQNGE